MSVVVDTNTARKVSDLPNTAESAVACARDNMSTADQHARELEKFTKDIHYTLVIADLAVKTQTMDTEECAVGYLVDCLELYSNI